MFRLIELLDRVSDVMKSCVRFSPFDRPFVLFFAYFSLLKGMHVSLALSIVKFEDLAYNVAAHERMYESDIITFPWLLPVHDAVDGPLTAPLLLSTLIQGAMCFRLRLPRPREQVWQRALIPWGCGDCEFYCGCWE